MKILDFGCGKKKYPGSIGIDIAANSVADIKRDLNKFPYPFKENSVEYVKMGHIIEHLEDPTSSLLEIHRICMPRAKIKINAPHFTSLTAYADLTHKRPGISYFTFGSWWTNKELNKKFKVVKKKLIFTRTQLTFLNKIFNPIINLSPALYERFFCWLLPCSEVEVVLEVVK